MRKLILSIILTILLVGGFSHTAGASQVKVWYLFDQTWWHWWYKKNCSTWNLRPTNNLLLGIAFDTKDSSSPTAAAKKLGEKIAEARGLGFEVIPEYTMRFHRGSKKPFIESWFDRKVWEKQAKYVQAIAAKTMDASKRFAIDIEPYWSGGARYMTNRQAYRFAYAVVPLIETIRSLGIKELWVMPGRLIYEHIKVLAAYGLNLKVLDEGTYRLPDFFHLDKSEYEKRMKVSLDMEKAHAAVGIHYLPGFYETALKQPGFVNELRAKGIHEAWVFPRRGGSFDPDKNKGADVSRHHKFCDPSWFNWEKYLEFWKK